MGSSASQEPGGKETWWLLNPCINFGFGIQLKLLSKNEFANSSHYENFSFNSAITDYELLRTKGFERKLPPRMQSESFSAAELPRAIVAE